MKKDTASKGPSWFVGKYKKGDEKGILELFKLAGIKRAREDWYWAFRDNPAGQFIWVGESDGQIVGHVAHIPALMKIDGGSTTGGQIVDVLVHPAFRRQGMFLALEGALLEEAEEKGMEITYGFPNLTSGHLKVGGFIVSEVPSLLKFVKIKSLIFLKSALRYKTSRNVAEILLRILLTRIRAYSRKHNRTSNRIDPENVKIRAIESFDHRIDNFWKKVSKRHDIVVIRNKKYLNWRYFKKPNVEYTVLLAEKEEEILGYIILRCRKEKYLNAGYIVDVLASYNGIIQTLILKAIEHFKKENVDLIRCFMLKNNAYYKTLRNNSFIPIESRVFMARSNTPRLSDAFLQDYTKWYVTIGDTDFI